jgi:hypothetical protein
MALVDHTPFSLDQEELKLLLTILVNLLRETAQLLLKIPLILLSMRSRKPVERL